MIALEKGRIFWFPGHLVSSIPSIMMLYFLLLVQKLDVLVFCFFFLNHIIQTQLTYVD